MSAQTTRDAFLGGLLQITQPREGYRAGVDAVFLAAACPAKTGQRVLELGCGVGAAMLCLAKRTAGLRVTGVEVQPDYADLARANATHNGIEAEVITADLRALPADLRNRSFDHVFINPPYYQQTATTAARDSGRDTAHRSDTSLAEWIDIGARRLAPKGYLTLIQRIDRLPEAIVACDGRLGSLVVLPLAGREGRAPERFLLQARKDGRAAFRLCPTYVLHRGATHERDQESYTAQTRRILRDGAALHI